MSEKIIPSWQQAPTSSPVTSSAEPEKQPESTESPEQPEQNSSPIAEASVPTEDDSEDLDTLSLLDQAKRFLDDPTIRDAPREKKVAFLESKGISADEIGILLGGEAQENEHPNLEEASECAWSTAPSQPIEARQPSQPSQPSSSPREIPPIVTYPEFLAQTEKPPPLITTQRLMNTAYVAGGLMATIYGFSKYIIAPMAQDLADSRHDFATHTQEQLLEFNKRLADSVSVDPASNAKTKVTDILDDVSEADSDPTELYHRDFGTQTTPTLSRRQSVSIGTGSEPIVTGHENRLKIIKSHLQELESTRSSDTVSADSLKTKVSELSNYLSDMSYQNQYYSNMGNHYGASFGLPGARDGKNDQIEVLKNDIRAVKGVFLSARNFPGGRNTSMSTGRTGA